MILEHHYLQDGIIGNEYWELYLDTETNLVTVSFFPADSVDISWGQSDREYELPSKVKRFICHGSYTMVVLENDEAYQFKFEDDGFFVGDVFEWDIFEVGEHIRDFAMWDFYND
jgi:hypothetical protein